MKSYKNKKFYNFKEVHKRKKRIRSTQRWWKTSSADYLKEKRQHHRIVCKVILRKKVEGQEIEFPLYKRTLWWDS